MRIRRADGVGAYSGWKPALLSAVFLLLALSIAPPNALAAAEDTETAQQSDQDLVAQRNVEFWWWIAPIGSIAALLATIFLFQWMKRKDPGNEQMQEIAGAVREGAFAYLRRQYKVVGLVFLVLVFILTFMAYMGWQNPFVPVAFLTGGFFSGLCGFLGMNTATYASNRTAQAARGSLNSGLQVAFRSGAVMGLVVVGFGLLDICLWYLILDKLVFTAQHMQGGLQMLGLTFVKAGTTEMEKLAEITTTMLTFGMGASTQALFARVGGGIYTKAADVGADLVGKVEAGIPEDDPRNPATIADNVGDNVGDVAGMGADLYESYCGSILATAALGAALPLAHGGGLKAVLAPMIVAGIGIIISILSIFFVRCREDATQKNLLWALRFGTIGSAVLIALTLLGMVALGLVALGICLAVWAGLFAGVIIGLSTEYFTSDNYKPTRGISMQSQTGPATVIIEGFSVGMLSSFIPALTIVAGILTAFFLAGGGVDPSMGLYGIAFAAVGMLATLGITLATDAYGPIADNAGGNAQMSDLPPEVRERTDALDALGNTTAATGKGFAIGSAALTAMALLSAYIEEVRIWIGRSVGADGLNLMYQDHGYVFFKGSTPSDAMQSAFNALPGHDSLILRGTHNAGFADFVGVFGINVMNPAFLCGLFIGAMMAFVFCGLAIKAVGRAARAMVEEVRRQFREKPGIMEGKEKPDYARCVYIATAGAQKEMILPSLLAIITPVLVGVVLNVAGVMGLLAGSLTTGFILAALLNNAGGAWDNAKKYVEKGNMGGKGSANHKALVVGDTVGDPFKDTAGPSLNILLKLMAMVSIVFSGLVIALSNFGF
jgi:K(+)-stimulated pyrophosphate-energized sodium pump